MNWAKKELRVVKGVLSWVERGVLIESCQEPRDGLDGRGGRDGGDGRDKRDGGGGRDGRGGRDGGDGGDGRDRGRVRLKKVELS